MKKKKKAQRRSHKALLPSPLIVVFLAYQIMIIIWSIFQDWLTETRKQVASKSWNRTQYNTYQGNPKYNIFINKAVEILVQKQKCWAYESCVEQMHFTFSHVSHLQMKEKPWCRCFHARATVCYTVNQVCAQITSFKNYLAILNRKLHFQNCKTDKKYGKSYTPKGQPK